MSCFATTHTFSSAQSGSGQPPDRAQICSFADDVPFNIFLYEPVSEPPKVNLRHRNVKMNVQKSDIATNISPNCAKHGPGSNYSPVETAFRKRVVVVAGIRK